VQFSYIFWGGGGGWSGTEATVGLLYQPPMMMTDEGCEAIGEMLGKENRSARRKAALSVALSITNPTRARTWAAAVGCQRLTS
jgi:hypothetical protein